MPLSPSRPVAAEPEPEPDRQPGPEPPEPPGDPLWRESYAAAPRLTAMERLASRPVTMSRPSNGLRLAWAATLVVLAVVIGSLLLWRGDVMQAWPPSTRLYSVLGLALEPPGGPAR